MVCKHGLPHTALELDTLAFSTSLKHSQSALGSPGLKHGELVGPGAVAEWSEKTPISCTRSEV